jgi:hypothetical protein
MGFVLYVEYTAIISLNNINQLLFRMEMQCILCEALTEDLNIFLTNLNFQMLK